MLDRLICAAVFLASCGPGQILEVRGVDAGEGRDIGLTDASSLGMREVPTPLAPLTVTSSCTPLIDGERPLSTSQEGYLWLVGTATVGGVPVRVLDGWGERPSVEWLTRFTEVNALRAETASVASVVADGGLWVLRNGRRVSVSAPFAPQATATACGSLGDAGFVLAGSGLFERTGDTWLQWSGLDALLDQRVQLMDRDGACLTAGDTLHLRAGDLEVWALTDTAATQIVFIDDADTAVLRESQLLVLSNGALVDDVTNGGQWAFAEGDIEALGAAGTYAWMRVGTTLVRFDGREFRQAGTVGSNATLLPFAAGGLWVVDDGFACAIQPRNMIRVEGIIPGVVVTATTTAFEARVFDETEDVRLQYAGTNVQPIGSASGRRRYAVEIAPGWTTLRFTTASGAERTLELRGAEPAAQTPGWATDIQPIYVAHCSAAGCHVPESTSLAPSLDTFEAWVRRAAAIQTRVVEQRDMPPAAAQGPTWNEDAIQTIADWLAGGTRP